MGIVDTAISVGLVLAGTLIGLMLLAYAYITGKMAFRLVTTSTSPTNELSEGFVAVRGRVDRPAVGPMRSPFAGRECVAAEWTVEEYSEPTSKSGHWGLEADGGIGVPFYVRDDHGEVLVDFGGDVADAPGGRFADEVAAGDGGTATEGEAVPTFESNNLTEVQWTIDGEEATLEVGVKDEEGPPAHVREFVEAHERVSEQSGSMMDAIEVGTVPGDRRYVENRLATGDEVFVLGYYDRGLDAITVVDDAPMLVSDRSRRALVGKRAVLAVGSVLGGLALLGAVAYYGPGMLL